MTYGVWCEVWGGVAGHRASWLKLDGQVQAFADRQQADDTAQALMDSIACNPHPKALFSYTVRELER